ncbi:MAG: hypothetical protein ACM3MK_00805 [Chitinophagales bacterium]
MTQGKKILYYLLYAVVLIGVFIFAQWVTNQMQHRASITFDPVVPWLISSLVNILPGLLLGLEHILRERSLPGSWRVNWTRLICLGIPVFYIDFCDFIAFATLTFPVLMYIPVPIQNTAVWAFGGAALGYILVTSFKKEAINMEANTEA